MARPTVLPARPFVESPEVFQLIIKVDQFYTIENDAKEMYSHVVQDDHLHISHSFQHSTPSLQVFDALTSKTRHHHLQRVEYLFLGSRARLKHEGMPRP